MFGLGSYQTGRRRQGLKKVVIVVAGAQLQPGEQWSDGNTGRISQGEAWEMAALPLGTPAYLMGLKAAFHYFSPTACRASC